MLLVVPRKLFLLYLIIQFQRKAIFIFINVRNLKFNVVWKANVKLRLFQ